MIVTLNKQKTDCTQHMQQNVLVDKSHSKAVSEKGEDADTPAMAVAYLSKIRRKRTDKEADKKKNKRRRGRGGRNKKTQAAHFVLKKSLLSSGGPDCPPGTHTGRIAENRTLDIFEPATFTNSKTNPFNVIDGKFIAKKDGLYLVYAQILFEDCKPTGVMRIVQNRIVSGSIVVIQDQFCFVSVPLKAKDRYLNTCSLTSLFYLEANDYLVVMNYYAEVHINVRSNASFLGAVFLR